MDRIEDNSPSKRQLAALYDAFASGLYRHALMILADPAGAEDAVQQVFAKLATRGCSWLDPISPPSYLRTAVRNECYRVLARPHPVSIVDSEAPPLLVPVDAALVAEEERQILGAALQALPPEQREVIHLKVYEDWTFQQIAELLGVSINTAASRYRYALEKLRQRLAAGPVSPDTGQSEV